MPTTITKRRRQERRALAATWATENPVLLAGEIGFETDTGKFKFGDGTTAWNSLPYAAGEGGASDWGDLGGTLADQRDLQTALDAKAAAADLTSEASTRSAADSALTTSVASAAAKGFTYGANITNADATITVFNVARFVLVTSGDRVVELSHSGATAGDKVWLFCSISSGVKSLTVKDGVGGSTIWTWQGISASGSCKQLILFTYTGSAWDAWGPTLPVNGFASQGAAQGGTQDNSVMSPLRTADAITAQAAPLVHESRHLPAGADPLPWTTIHGRGTTGSKPSAASGNAGYLYFDTDLGTLQRSSGSAWQDVVEGGGFFRFTTAVGDGSTDDTAALQADLDAIAASTYGGILILKPGRKYKTTSTLTYTANGKRLGILGNHARIRNATATGNTLSIYPPGHADPGAIETWMGADIRDLWFDPTVNRTNGRELDIERAWKPRVINCRTDSTRVTDWGGTNDSEHQGSPKVYDAVRFYDCFDPVIDDYRFTFKHRGISVDTSLVNLSGVNAPIQALNGYIGSGFCRGSGSDSLGLWVRGQGGLQISGRMVVEGANGAYFYKGREIDIPGGFAGDATAGVVLTIHGVYRWTGNNLWFSGSTGVGLHAKNAAAATVLGFSSYSGTFAPGNTVTGGTSGATATVVAIGGPGVIVSGVSGTFQAGETITTNAGGSASSISAPQSETAITNGHIRIVGVHGDNMTGGTILKFDEAEIVILSAASLGWRFASVQSQSPLITVGAGVSRFSWTGGYADPASYDPDEIQAADEVKITGVLGVDEVGVGGGGGGGTTGAEEIFSVECLDPSLIVAGDYINFYKADGTTVGIYWTVDASGDPPGTDQAILAGDIDSGALPSVTDVRDQFLAALASISGSAPFIASSSGNLAIVENVLSGARSPSTTNNTSAFEVLTTQDGVTGTKPEAIRFDGITENGGVCDQFTAGTYIIIEDASGHTTALWWQVNSSGSAPSADQAIMVANINTGSLPNGVTVRDSIKTAMDAASPALGSTAYIEPDGHLVIRCNTHGARTNFSTNNTAQFTITTIQQGA